jgi:hypothetical protein
MIENLQRERFSQRRHRRHATANIPGRENRSAENGKKKAPDTS